MFEGAANARALLGRETLGEMTLRLERLLHDAAIRVREGMESFLKQPPDSKVPLAETLLRMADLARQV